LSGDLTINDSVEISGDVEILVDGDLVINSTNTTTQTVQGNGDGNPDSLTLLVNGSITINGQVGGADLHNLVMESGGTITVIKDINVTGQFHAQHNNGFLSTGSVTAVGPITFNKQSPGPTDQPDVVVAGAVISTGGAVRVAASRDTIFHGIVSAGGGEVSITADRRFTAAGTLTATGSITLTAVDRISLANNVTAVGFDTSFSGPVLLTANVTVSTGAGAGNIQFSDAIDGAHDLSLNAGTGGVTLGGAVGATTALGTVEIEAGSATAMTIGHAVTADTLSITTAGGVTIGAALQLGADSLEITDSGGPIAINAPITTQGGKVFLTAGRAITSTNAGTITTTGTADAAQGTNGGEVLLRSTGAGNISLAAAITTTGGETSSGTNDGGNAGHVTITNSNGSVQVHNIVARGGASAGGLPGKKGTIQLSASAGITQANTTTLTGSALKIIAGGNVTLTNGTNDVRTLAVLVSGGGLLNYVNQYKLTIGTIGATGTGAASLPEKKGIVLTGGNGTITVNAAGGTLIIENDVSAAGSGRVELRGRDIFFDAAVSSVSGDVYIITDGIVSKSERASADTTGDIGIQGLGQFPAGVGIDLSADFDWLAQGPEVSTGGQVLGMDTQGNPVSAAIQSVYQHPTDPNVIYIGTVNGGLWKTTNIYNTLRLAPTSPGKTEAPDSAAPFNAVEGTGGNLTQNGVYRYRITFVDSVGNESNASDFREWTLSGNNNKFTFDHIPKGPAGTAKRNIYRTEDSSNLIDPHYYLALTIDDNTTEDNVEDTLSDAELCLKEWLEVEVPWPVWQPLTDEYPSLAVGALAFDPEDPDIMYVGTGSRSSSAKGGPSIGLLKTTDGGKSFILLGEAEFSGVKIRDILTQKYNVGTTQVQYDAVHKRLTVFVNPDTDSPLRTTAREVVNAINALVSVPFKAALFQQFNTGAGFFEAAEFENVTRGGVNNPDGKPAVGAIFPAGGNNAITLTANANGDQYNGVKVVLESDGIAGAEDADYDEPTKTLTISLVPGVTTAGVVVDAIKTEGTFDAKLARNDGSGTYAAGTTQSRTSGGDDDTKATLVFNPDGDNNAIVFTAGSNGVLYNDIDVVFTSEIDQVLVATERYSGNGGLFISLDGGYAWRLISGVANAWRITNDAANSMCAAQGDLNGDGHMDLVVGNTGAQNTFYLNNKTVNPFPTTVAAVPFGPNVNSTTDVAVGDIDGDGHPDIVTANSNAVNRVYFVNESGALTGVTRDVGTANDTTTSIALGDLDNDGDLDIVEGNSGAGNDRFKNRYFLNDGNGNFDAGTVLGDQIERTSSLALADMNNDGRMDVVVGNSGTNAAPQIDRIYYQDYDAVAGTFTFNTAGLGAAALTYSVAVGDMNNDGVMDVVAGVLGGANKLFLRRPNNTYVDSNIGEQTDSTTSVALGDLNGDGWLDVVFGNGGQRDLYFLNNRSADPFNGVAGIDVYTLSWRSRDVVLGDFSGANQRQPDLVVVHDRPPGGRINVLYRDFASILPGGTVTDLLMAPDNDPAAASGKAYFAAVVGVKGHIWM